VKEYYSDINSLISCFESYYILSSSNVKLICNLSVKNIPLE